MSEWCLAADTAMTQIANEHHVLRLLASPGPVMTVMQLITVTDQAELAEAVATDLHVVLEPVPVCRVGVIHRGVSSAITRTAAAVSTPSVAPSRPPRSPASAKR